MIVSMKRITIVGLAPEQENILHQLRQLGIVHIHHIKPPEGASLEKTREGLTHAETALRVLPVSHGQASTAFQETDAAVLARQIWEIEAQIKTSGDELATLEREAAKVSVFGDFQPDTLAQLAGKGIALRLYEISSDRVAQIPAGVVYSILARPKGKVIFAVVQYGKHIELPFSPIPVPERSFGQVQQIIAAKKAHISGLEKKLSELASCRGHIENHHLELQNRLEFEQVRHGMGAHESLVYLQGYCPAQDVASLTRAAQEHSWALLAEEPSSTDEPPTLIRNPFIIRIIQPVFRIIGTVPGYREFDIDLWFLIFFSIFFAILVGDAGYGTLYLLGTAAAHWKLGKKIKQKEPFFLLYLLAVATMVWGGMSGVWFGQEWISKLFPFNRFVVPSLYGFSSVSQNTVIRLCFVLAVIHLTLAHTIAAIRVFPSLLVVAQVGWISFMWGVYFLARFLVLGEALPPATRYLLAAGIALVLFLGSPQKTVWETLKQALSNSLNTALGFVSAFADTISYIRLFAVGLTGLAISQSFQSIAMQVGFNNVFTGLGAALILLGAHSLNIALGLMSVLVHGLRLNMLEFSGHLGIQWSGYGYKPFKKIERE